jgi:hypothetical protein
VRVLPMRLTNRWKRLWLNTPPATIRLSLLKGYEIDIEIESY